MEKETNLVCHGHPRIGPCLHYVQLSRSQALESTYVEDFHFDKIRPDPDALEENKRLCNRSIVQSYRDNSFCVFMVNIRSLKNKIAYLTEKDIYAPKADHICVVETWLDPKEKIDFNVPGRTFGHASYGGKKGCGIFSLSKQKLSQDKHFVVREKYQLMSLVDETNPQLHYQLIVVYASQGCPWKELANTLGLLVKSKMTVIITGDFNFDKRLDGGNEMTTLLSSLDFQQVVTWPTRDSGRTIDHCYIKGKIRGQPPRVQLTRYSPFYSDHDALCIQFESFPWWPQ